MSSYTKVLLKEFFTALKAEIIDCYREADISDEELENILVTNTEDWHANED
jgi:hypothetical protein